MAILADLLDEDEMASSLPEAARAMFRIMTDMLDKLGYRIADLDKEIARRAREDEVARRLMTIPGIGPIAATAIVALAPHAATFSKGRDFAAWLGLAPLQHSTGGKQRLGRISKMGRANNQAASHHWRQRGREAGYNTWRAGRLVAGRDAGTQAPDSGLRGARQQVWRASLGH